MKAKVKLNLFLTFQRLNIANNDINLIDLYIDVAIEKTSERTLMPENIIISPEVYRTLLNSKT